MKRWLASFFLVAASCLIPASAQALWGGAEYGMSVKEARSSVSGSSPVDNGRKLGDGTVEMLRVSDIEILGAKFRASLFFDEEMKLNKVIVILDERLTPPQAESLYDRLITVLRAKYGREIDDTKGGVLNFKALTWLSGKTDISAWYRSIGDAPPSVDITYQVRLSKEAESL